MPTSAPGLGSPPEPHPRRDWAHPEPHRFLCIYVDKLPTETQLRVWDVLFCEGARALARACVSCHLPLQGCVLCVRGEGAREQSNVCGDGAQRRCKIGPKTLFLIALAALKVSERGRGRGRVWVGWRVCASRGGRQAQRLKDGLH